jgi:hypothetical protein
MPTDENGREIEDLDLPDLDPDDISDLDLDDLDDDELLAEFEEMELEAVGVLQDALAELMGEAAPTAALREAAANLRAGIESRAWPHRHLAAAAGWVGAPDDDAEVVLGAAGVLVSPREETGFDLEEESVLHSLELVDWVGAVIGLVRAGAGASATPQALLGYLNDCPELEGDDVEGGEAALVETGYELILPAWQAAGAVDDDRRLTALGRWVLPRALAWAWELDFDEPVDDGDE